MIDEYEKLVLPDENSGKDIIVEVNYEDNPATDQCKILKLTLPDIKNVFIKKEYLMSLMFAIGNAEEQRKSIPQRISHSRWYDTVVSVKATKDIRKDEKITFPIRISLPAYEEEVLGQGKSDGIKKLKEKRSEAGLII